MQNGGIALVQGIIVPVTLVYSLKCGLDDGQKEYLCDTLITVACMFREKKVVGIAKDLNGFVAGIAEHYEDQHGGYSLTFRNKGDEKIREFCVDIKMTQGNIVFKNRGIHLVPYESGVSKTHIDYCVVKGD